jgi:tRNA-dihydrouridine synthase B
VRAVKESTGYPVTVKMRLGWDEASGAVRFAKAMAAQGADMLVIHGRTVSQGYSGKADWGAIEAAASEVAVPVVGNGDVLTAQEALERLEKGPCRGIMVGRALLGHPMFFDELAALLRGQEPEDLSVERRMSLAKEHFIRSIERCGERKGLLEMRKQLVFYFRGMRGAPRLRESLLKEKSPEGVVRLLEEGWRTFQ